MHSQCVAAYAVLMRVLVLDDSVLVRERLLGWLSATARVELGEVMKP